MIACAQMGRGTVNHTPVKGDLPAFNADELEHFLMCRRGGLCSTFRDG